MIPDFEKYPDQLIPTIVQDAKTCKVLMLGYMNHEAWSKTVAEKKVTFFSRSKQRLWTKGETSGNFLNMESISLDCDNDSFLIKATPVGPVCHTGADTCFSENNNQFSLSTLEDIIAERKANGAENSYVASLFKKGINKIAQKVGEEAVEIVIEAKDNDDNLFKNEAADLLFHYLILLQAKGFKLDDIIAVLQERHK